MKKTYRITAVILSLMMVLTCIPAIVFADDGAAEEYDPAEIAEEAEAAEYGDSQTAEEDLPEDIDAVYSEDDSSDVGFGEESGSNGIDAEGLEGADPETQAAEFMFADESAGVEKGDGYAPARTMSVKGDRLTGNNLKYYNNYKTIIEQVSAGTRTNAYKTVKVGTWLGKRKFTASQLGLKKIGYKSGGKWYMTSAAKKKVSSMLDPGDWKAVYTSLLSDLSNTSYWVDWYAEANFYSWKCNYEFTKDTITFTKDSYISFYVPVMPEFAKEASATQVYSFIADQEKLSAASTAKKNAQIIVDQFAKDIDTSKYTPAGEDKRKLEYYCEWIAYLTTYDQDAAEDAVPGLTTPWSWISVLDNLDSTKAVCAGYARAFKYLCDLSSFNSDWIDCQVVSGLGDASNPKSNHMWNIVRMDDGLNYLVDPTWMDEDSDSVDKEWFLRGDPSGTANRFTIQGVTRQYDNWVITTFPVGERKLSEKSYYEEGSNLEIFLSKPVIKTPVRGKKKITVKWNAVTSPLGALYVDGYQIRYSTKSSMKSGVKTLTVKGYKKASRVISKLKSNKIYYVQVRSYAKIGGKLYYSDWSAKKKVKTK